MSLDSLIPSNVLVAMVEETLRKSLVFGDVVNRDYEGTIRAAGDSVKIPVIGDVSVSDYTKGQALTYPGVDATDMLMPIDQQKLIEFSVDILDETRSPINIAQRYTDRAAYGLRDTADQYIASLHSEAGVTDNLGTTATPLTITAKTTAGSNIGVNELLSRISVKMDEADVPSEGRYLVVPPWLHGKLTMAGILELSTVDQGAYTNGKVGRVQGFDIRVSNNIVNAKTTGSKVMAGTIDAISFAAQITRFDTFPLQNKFGTGVRGLYVYGSKVVQSSALAVATVSEADG